MKVDASRGGTFVLFNGNVTGKFQELVSHNEKKITTLFIFFPKEITVEPCVFISDIMNVPVEYTNVKFVVGPGISYLVKDIDWVFFTVYM